MSALIIDAIDEAMRDLVPLIGAKAACQAVGLPRASYYLASGGPARGSELLPALVAGMSSSAQPPVRRPSSSRAR